MPPKRKSSGVETPTKRSSRVTVQKRSTEDTPSRRNTRASAAASPTKRTTTAPSTPTTTISHRRATRANPNPEPSPDSASDSTDEIDFTSHPEPIPPLRASATPSRAGPSRQLEVYIQLPNRGRSQPQDTQPTLQEARIESPTPPQPPPSPSKKAGKLPLSQHGCLYSQRRAILRALSNPTSIDVSNSTEQETEMEMQNDAANATTFQDFTELLSGTVDRGEGNSCLLLGPRGSGKTRLVERCLSNLPAPPIVIRLSGWAQTNDRLALREIAWQLAVQTGTPFEDQQESEEDPEANPFIDDGEQPNTVVNLPSAAYLPLLIATLTARDRPCIVILDAFDLFASHSRQSLIYCLLDTAQIRQAGNEGKGLLVVGLTSHIETINILEKRVKSRFSGRMMRVSPPSPLKDWLDVVRTILRAKPKYGEDNEDDHEQAQFTASWEQDVDRFLAERRVQDIFNDTFGVSKDMRMLSRILTATVVHLTPDNAYLSASRLEKAASAQRILPRLPFLNDLPYPSLCLLVAHMHSQVSGHDAATFEMLHETVHNQVRSSSLAPVQLHGGSIGMTRTTRQVLLAAFEGLVMAHVFVCTAAPSANVAKEFMKYRCAVDKEEMRNAVDRAGRTDIKKWFNKL